MSIPRDVDLLILGRGIGGLSAALHGAVEGYSTLALGPDAGQLAGSTMVENYAGYARISGRVLLHHIQDQAMAQGARVVEGRALSYINKVGEAHLIETSLGVVSARAVILALGVRWTRARCEVAEALAQGDSAHTGVSYGTPYSLEGKERVVIVGAGNGGGQAALYLADRGSEVTLLARRPLASTMSSYLLKRVERSRDRITCSRDGFLRCEAEGGKVTRVFTQGGQEIACEGLALFMGGRPEIPPGFPVNEQGFVPVGAADFETAISGVYAVGDCRAGSYGRASAAAGEAAAAVALIGQRQLAQRFQTLPNSPSHDYNPLLTKGQEMPIFTVEGGKS